MAERRLIQWRYFLSRKKEREITSREAARRSGFIPRCLIRPAVHACTHLRAYRRVHVHYVKFRYFLVATLRRAFLSRCIKFAPHDAVCSALISRARSTKRDKTRFDRSTTQYCDGDEDGGAAVYVCACISISATREVSGGEI